MALLFAGSDREDTLEQRCCAKSAEAGKKPYRILSDLKIAPITPAKNRSATTVSAIFHSIGKFEPHPLPRKIFIVIPATPHSLALIQPALFWSYGPRNIDRTVWLCLYSRANKTDPMMTPLTNIAMRAGPARLGGVGLAPQSCLSRRALSRQFIRKHSIHYYQFEFGGMCLKTSERGKPHIPPRLAQMVGRALGDWGPLPGRQSRPRRMVRSSLLSAALHYLAEHADKVHCDTTSAVDSTILKMGDHG